MRVLILLLMLLLPGLSQAQPGDDLFAPRGAPPPALRAGGEAVRVPGGGRAAGPGALRGARAPGGG
ncbi:thiol:disulfide interchange protein, partial [Pseudomonas aeruginosa]|nr:thiol:disulfide interchange protein [Pseudomonas aeruginosa]